MLVVCFLFEFFLRVLRVLKVLLFSLFISVLVFLGLWLVRVLVVMVVKLSGVRSWLKCIVRN